MRLTRHEFTELVREAFEGLPDKIKEALDNVEVMVAAQPSWADLEDSGVHGSNTLLGLYTGVPLTERGSERPLLPDQITLFQRAIESKCSSRAAILSEVLVTLLHEVGHYLGMSEVELRRRGYG